MAWKKISAWADNHRNMVFGHQLPKYLVEIRTGTSSNTLILFALSKNTLQQLWSCLNDNTYLQGNSLY